MQPTIRLKESLGLQGLDQRAEGRTPIALPILIMFEGSLYSALLHNLSSAGAKINTSAPLKIQSEIEFQCGLVCANGTVVWSARNNYGLKFGQTIADQQLSEQFSRSEAVVAWSESRAIGPVSHGHYTRAERLPNKG